MFNNSVFLLLSITLLGVKADTTINNDQNRLAILDTIEKFKPEIANIHNKLDSLTAEMGEIDEIISSGLTRLHLIHPESERIIETLKNIVQQTLQESLNGNIDTTTCLDDEKVTQNKLQAKVEETIEEIIEEAQPGYEKHSKDLSILKNRLPDIGGKVDKIIRACVLQNLLPWQNDALVRCITKDVEKINAQIDRLRSATGVLNEKVTDIFADMEGRLGGMLEYLVHDMVTIIEQLKECISMLSGETEEVPTETPSEVSSEVPSEIPTELPTETPTDNPDDFV